MSIKYNEGFFEQLSRSPGVVSLVKDSTEAVATEARTDAPRDTEDYVNGIEVQMKFQKRVVGLVVGTDKKTMIIESKTGNLARALTKAARKRKG